jgi:hypothetical protein
MVHWDAIFVDGTGSVMLSALRAAGELRVAWAQHEALFECVLPPERVSRMVLARLGVRCKAMAMG